MKKNTQWFSMVEILIWIFIFSLGLVSIYALIISMMNLNEYSKNSIIATNLARESTELVRNIRDNNYENFYKWNKFPWSDVSKVFSTGVYYTIENDLRTFSNDDVRLQPISDFVEGKDHLVDMEDYKLCINPEGLYTYDCTTPNTKTYFYRYIVFDDVVYQSGGLNTILPDALKVTSKVIWYKKWYHEIQLKTILTDYLRQ